MKKLWKWLIIIGAIILVLIVSAVALIMYEATHMVSYKPAIYLYPTSDSIVNVNVNFNGNIITSIPKYDSGWSVFATTYGEIDGKYDYLFYEASLNDLKLPKEGWVVSYGNLDKWFDVNLKELGLTEKEKNQFKEYWLNKLQKSDYYEIKLLDNNLLNQNDWNLITNPAPDTLIRIELYFKPLKYPEQISQPTITTPERKGFTVVEWGGILDN